MKFIVSAPGKVILFGEHAVVYGYPAISAAIGLKCYFEVTTNQKSQSNMDFLTVTFQDLGQKSICLSKSLCSTINPKSTGNTVDHAWLLVSDILNLPNDSSSRQNSLNLSLCVIVFLILRIVCLKPDLQCSNSPTILDPETSIHLKIYSDIPQSAGLGSSAAYSVCASTVLLYLFGYVSPNLDGTINTEQLNMVQKLAHEAESIIHGKSSGLDTSTSVQGGLLVYQNSGHQPCLTKLAIQDGDQSDLVPMDILLVDSRVTRSTQTIVQFISNAYQTNSEIDSTFKQIGNIVQSAISLLKQPNSLDSFDKLGQLVNQNQELLGKLRVSCPQLDDLVSFLNQHAIPAKLTGAGCGGFVIGFPLPLDKQNSQLAPILDQLHNDKHLWAQIVRISKHGVRFKMCSL